MIFLLSIFGALLVSTTSVAQTSGCWGYLDEEGHCVGCNEPYFYSLCTWGCVHGYCTSHGGSGQCSCGYRYYTASISSDGGDCAGEECGLVRVRVSRLAQKKKERNAELRMRGGSAQAGFPYPSQRLLFVVNPCNHSFDLVQRDVRPLAGGM